MTLRDACASYHLPSLSECQRERSAGQLWDLNVKEEDPP